MRFFWLITLLFSVTSHTLGAPPVQKGFDCLARYDYFKARELFYTCTAKENSRAYASYGLAVIYYRRDNPFHHLDSAVKYLQQGYAYYQQKPAGVEYSQFKIDSAGFRQLGDSIAIRQFSILSAQRSVKAYEHFLSTNYLAPFYLRKRAMFLRDELEFTKVQEHNRSDSTKQYLQRFPQSAFGEEAMLLYDRQIFEEYTLAGTDESYLFFLSRFPKNRMTSAAYEKLFTSYKEKSSVKGLAMFVKQYPYAPQCMDAWKLLFSLSVKDYSYSELKRFLEEYPEFPLKNSIFRELELNKLELYAYQLGDYVGFTDRDGKMAVPAVYDAVSDFHEGLSVVSKNDTVFFINKEGSNAFGKVYSDAQIFRNGIAAVKQNGKWFFINRQGQGISVLYDEINDLSNDVYVVMQNNRYGALDAYGKTILEPRFDKLGDFKNGYAYYIESGLYGFVSIKGVTHKAEFEWISDFNEELVAVVKQKSGYGIVQVSGKWILEPVYELVMKTSSPYFVVVNKGSYGIIHSSGCFVCPIQYEFMKDKSAEFYTDGHYFRLNKKGKLTVCDENGVTCISANQYDELNFPVEGYWRVRKNNKYTYLDKKFNPVMPFKYDMAEDFTDSLARVSLKEKTCFINYKGEERVCSPLEIERLSTHYYLVNAEPKYIVDMQGNEVVKDVWQVQKPGGKNLIVTLLNGEIKLLTD